MRQKYREYRRKPAPRDEDERPAKPPVQAPPPTYLDDKRMRPTNQIIKAGAKSHHCPIKDDGDHPFTNRCFNQSHGGYCPIHKELVSYRHGCNIDGCTMKGKDLIGELTNPRAISEDNDVENLPRGQIDDTQDQASKAKLTRVVKKDPLKEGDRARDANDNRTYTFGIVHRNDPGLKNMSQAQDAHFYAKKAKQAYRRTTMLKLGS